MKCCRPDRLPTVAALAFAAGILLTQFLPPVALTVLLALAILAAGILTLIKN